MNLTKPRGFTLIEVMIVVVIVGILAAIAIPAFLAYMNKAKSIEVPEQLAAIGKKEKSLFGESGSFTLGTAAKLPTNTPLAPGLDCCGGKGGGNGTSGAKNVAKCTADAAAFQADPVWKQIEFSINEETSYEYSYVGASDHFTASAYGDVDCDGVEAVYTLAGTLDANKVPSVGLTQPAGSTY